MAAATGSNRIPPEDARRLISAHDGNVALLYIWQCVNSRFDAEAAARDLCMTAGEINAAKEKLDRLFASVISTETQNPVLSEKKAVSVVNDPPQLTPDDVKRILNSSSDFKSVVEEATRILGRALSTPDISTLLVIYDHLGISAEVMMELVNYCHEVTIDRFGPSKRVSVNMIYKEACRWAEEGIITFEAAEEYISAQKELNSRLSRVAAMLNLDSRHITDTPLKYIRTWIGMGFDNDAIAEAYDRTFTNTGNLSWKYMDAIIRQWHNAGLHSIKEIKYKDSRNKPTKQKTSSKPNDVNAKAVEELLKDYKR